MKKLKISSFDIELAQQINPLETSINAYLDTQTGDILFIDRSTQIELTKIVT